MRHDVALFNTTVYGNCAVISAQIWHKSVNINPI